MSKHSNVEAFNEKGSNKKQKIETSDKELVKKDEDSVKNSTRCSECLHKPCLWVTYGDQVEQRINEAMQELEGTISFLNERRSKARNAGYTLLSQLYRGFIHQRKAHPKCVVDAVRAFLPAIDGNTYTGFRP